MEANRFAAATDIRHLKVRLRSSLANDVQEGHDMRWLLKEAWENLEARA
jgi:hypothetical protein